MSDSGMVPQCSFGVFTVWHDFLIQVLYLSCISFACTPNETHFTNKGRCRYGMVYCNIPVAVAMFYIMLLQSCSESEYLHLECVTVCVYVCLTYLMILPVSQNMYVECWLCLVNNRLQRFWKERFGLHLFNDSSSKSECVCWMMVMFSK